MVESLNLLLAFVGCLYQKSLSSDLRERLGTQNETVAVSQHATLVGQ